MQQQQNLRQHKGRTYVLAARGNGPFQGRFILRAQDEGQMDNTRWHELDDEWSSEEEALRHADQVARQYITTFADQA
ncbi:hypothetical protein OU995_01410 [Roseateles sp. SL47]|jgi:hypothetical protein|uniref:hypothetical protein n=1 Tax=Roseateles sp. SL47 TaxID=2995138 RepID=UPI00226DE386|nr:hypothetical protein [Roseateles sp. SL47]WAC73436.1 hypothetical protein OU995_01410 [Roseateles sp. SL47]